MLNSIKELIENIKALKLINDVEFIDKKEYGFKNVENQIYIYEPKGQEYIMSKITTSCDEVRISINYVLVASFNCIDKMELVKLLSLLINNLCEGAVRSFTLDEDEIYFNETGQKLSYEANMIRIRFNVTEDVELSCINQICKPCC
jgi:hypothetical protein